MSFIENMKPAVSVIIPTFDRLPMLQEAIGSVRAQTFGDFECLVVDDGSTDGTAPAVEKVAAADARVRLLKQENRGVSAARNRGVEASRAPLVAFLDSDDLWHPEKLSRQVEVMQEGWALCHTDEVWLRRGARVNQRKRHAKGGGWQFVRSLELCCISPSAAVVRRDALEEAGGFDEDFPVCEDYDLWLRMTARWPVAFIAEPLTIKRGGHPGQLSASRWGMDRWRARAIEKLLEADGLLEGLRQAALEELHSKCDVLISGFARRGNEEEAARWRALKERHPLSSLKEASEEPCRA